MGTVTSVSDFTARRGLQTGRFLESCDHCPSVHRDYGLHWPSCDICAEMVCDECAQPGTTRLDDSNGTMRCMCVRCAEEAQQATMQRA